MISFLRRAALLLGLFAGTSVASAAPSYYLSGPQTNVAVATVTGGGWTQCYAATMDVSIGSAGENVLNNCNGTYLMMAGRTTGSSEFLVLAAALRADTILDTGQTSNTHLANGSEWWYSTEWSWGFTAAGDTVDNNQCNIDASSPTSMCLHTFSFVGGYRINDIENLNDSTDFEKIFFVANDVAAPEPTTLAVLCAGLFGLGIARRRNRA